MQPPLGHLHRLADQPDRADPRRFGESRPSSAPTPAPRRGSGTGRRSVPWGCRRACSSRTRPRRRSWRPRCSARLLSPYSSASVTRLDLNRRERDLARLGAERARLRDRQPACARRARDQAFRPAWPARRPVWSRRSSCSSIWLAASLRNVPGPNTTFTVFARASCPHGPFAPPSDASALAGTLPDRHPSRPSQPLDVRAQHQLLQVALHQHRDRLFAEAAVEALRVLVFAARARYERVRRRRRMQPQGQRRGAQREHHRDRDHRPRPSGRTARQGRQDA